MGRKGRYLDCLQFMTQNAPGYPHLGDFLDKELERNT